MIMRRCNALFITYDGLLDPLGGSQILPYLMDIAKHQASLHILSFEKPDKYAEGANALRNKLTENNISWTPLLFTRRFGKLGKLYDLLRMYAIALKLQLKSKFQIIHCRSYQAMQVGCFLKRISSVKTIFDMRGLLVDERIDGGIWNRDKTIDSMLYFTYKRIEKRLLVCANHVVALTHSVVPELKRIAPEMDAPVTVIPCCADFDHFVPQTDISRATNRAQIGVGDSDILVSYLGSLGTWYMVEEMLSFFARLASKNDNVHMLLITRDWTAEHERLIHALGFEGIRGRIHIHPASRGSVPRFLGASDVMLSFIKPAYSKMASSPTKLAEAFAMGIPVISNSGVGDVALITEALDAGAIVDLSNEANIAQTADDLHLIIAKGGIALRDRARKQFGLEVASRLYEDVYRALERAK